MRRGRVGIRCVCVCVCVCVARMLREVQSIHAANCVSSEDLCLFDRRLWIVWSLRVGIPEPVRVGDLEEEEEEEE